MTATPTAETRLEAVELVMLTMVSTIEHHHPGSIAAAILALRRRSTGTSNVVSMEGRPLATDPKALAYAVLMLDEAYG